MVCRLWKAATGITWVEAKDAAENLINAQDGPTTKDDLAQNVSNTKPENPCSTKLIKTADISSIKSHT